MGFPDRSECSCKACKVFCRVMPSFLVPEDLPSYMVTTGLDPDVIEQGVTIDTLMPWAKANLMASDGSRCAIGGVVVTIPTLVPKSKRNGSCVHYWGGHCAIHAAAPFGCRMFSCDTDEKLASKLSMSAAMRIRHVWDTLQDDEEDLSMVEALYASLWLELNSSGCKRKRTTVSLRKRVERELAKIRK